MQSGRAKWVYLIAVLIWNSLLFACATTTKDAGKSTEVTDVLQQQLTKADQALDREQFVAAQMILESLKPMMRRATESQRIHQDMMRFALHLHYRDLNQAEKVMHTIDSSRFYILPQALQARYYHNKMVLLEQLNRPLQAMHIRINKADLLYPDKNTAHSAILSHLLQLNMDEMQQGLARSPAGSIAQGWYALASDLSKNIWNISLQQQGLRRWLDQWRQHPASFVLPDYVAKLLQQQAKPVHIALVLPFSGPLAEVSQAIVTGFNLVHQQASREYIHLTRLSKIDSAALTASEILDRLQKMQVDFVIGPLNRDKVVQLAKVLQLQQEKHPSDTQKPQKTPQETSQKINGTAGKQPMQFLALNFLDTDTSTDKAAYRTNTGNKRSTSRSSPATPSVSMSSPSHIPSNFYQFGLNIRDEIDYLAERAFAAGYREVSILADQDPAGENARSIFTNKWHHLGGRVLHTYHFHARAADDLVDKLHRLSTAIKYNRTDALFFFGQASAARQVRPYLSFNKLTNVTVFSTAHIYSAGNLPVLDQDLEGIYFAEIPWTLEQRPEFNQQLLLKEGAKARSLGRFYALGMDAFIIYQHFAQLLADPDFTLPGVTGKLSMTSGQVIGRRPVLVRMRNSQAIPVSSIVKPGSISPTQ